MEKPVALERLLRDAGLRPSECRLLVAYADALFDSRGGSDHLAGILLRWLRQRSRSLTDDALALVARNALNPPTVDDATFAVLCEEPPC